jgi:mxaL protein
MTRRPGLFWGGAEFWLLLVAVVALATTFAKPSITTQRALVDHVIVIDITQSMNVPDYQLNGRPASRLIYAKHALRESLLAMPCGSKVGWGIFTEYRSFLLMAPVEVCANIKELRSTLDGIDGRMAWTGNSEIAKGLFSGIGIAQKLPDLPSIVFFTDGHESPPINARHRPSFDGKPGVVKGLIVGVGDLKPSPIPKFDPLGRSIGFWGADEVMQTDPRSHGREGSVGGEQLADDPDGGTSVMSGSTPGAEHLSSMREGYLRLLSSDTGLEFMRLQKPEELAAALTSPSLARSTPAPTDMRIAFGGLAFAALMTWLGLPLWRKWRTRR